MQKTVDIAGHHSAEELLELALELIRGEHGDQGSAQIEILHQLAQLQERVQKLQDNQPVSLKAVRQQMKNEIYRRLEGRRQQLQEQDRSSRMIRAGGISPYYLQGFKEAQRVAGETLV